MLLKRAFTLIELLVVVAIIAILIALLLPSLTRAREQGKAVKCESNLRLLSITAYLYAENNRGWLPEWGFAHGGGGGKSANSWLRSMKSEFGDQRAILRCPSDRSALWPRSAAQEREALQQEQDSKKITFRRTSFGTNYYLSAPGKNDTPAGEKAGHPFNRLDWLKRPANTAFFVELVEAGEFALADHVHPEEWDFFHPEEKAKAREQVFLDRHLGWANYAMVDGHAERLPFERTFAIDDGSSKNDDLVWYYNKYDPSVAR